MTPFGESHRYQEQIGAYLLGKLDAGDLKAMQTHLDSCPDCQAEVRELESVVAVLADAVPDLIDEDPQPPEDLEESTLAPILGEIHRARSRRRRFGWSSMAAAALFVVVMGLVGFTWLLDPGVAREHLSFSDKAPGVKVDGDLIAHTWGTEIELVVSGLRAGQTYIVRLVSEAGERFKLGTIIGTGDEQLDCTFETEKLLREDATRLEVRTPDGELAFLAKLPEEPRVEDRDSPPSGSSPLDGILPKADSDRPNEGSEECAKKPSPEDKPQPDKQEKPPKADGSGDGPPDEENPTEGDDKGPPPGGGEKPEPGPNRGGPGDGHDENPPDDEDPVPDPCDVPPEEQSPDDHQYATHTGSDEC
jgi:Putative zinc-finger